jgi:hypothetical protein
MLSCKANGVNPEEWLMDVLEKINDTKKSELINLLPNNWKKTKLHSNNKFYTFSQYLLERRLTNN